MQEQSNRNYQLIEQFVHGFIDKRMGAYKILKAADELCRQVVEDKLFKNPEIKKIITHNNDESLWIKDLIVNYTLLKMQSHAILWEIDSHKP